MSKPTSVTFDVKRAGFARGGSAFRPASHGVAAGGTVTLKTDKASESFRVYTWDSSGAAVSAFTEGAPPYDATFAGNELTLAAGVANTTITLTVTSTSPRPDETGANGTINVGSTGGDPE